jgi:methylated-DNA-[protein]-cysteine S-methyltransferase
MATRIAGRIETPLGPMIAVVDGAGAVREFHFPRSSPDPGPGLVWDDAALATVRRQVGSYFAGERRTFDLALEPQGTEFERAVWAELVRIPFGETISYGVLAMRLGRPGAARAVGRANGANPIPIIIPCHRVIGADGSLTGFGGGLPLKQALLDFERRASGREPPMLPLGLDSGKAVARGGWWT